MRAVVLQGAHMGLEDLPDPRPSVGQLLVAPRFNGICGSDLHLRESMRSLEAADQQAPHVLPRLVLGHEFSATVVGMGPGTDTDLKVGDRVAPIPFVSTSQGPQIVGLSATYGGGLAGLSIVVADRCFHIPEPVPDDLAALTEPLAVGLHAANLADRHHGPNIIIGCGPVGLAVVFALRSQGRGPILAADFSPTRRAIAESLGADILVDPATASPYDHWDNLAFRAVATSPLLERELRGRPRGVNIFDCVGSAGMIDQIVRNAPQHSHIILVGVCAHEDRYTPVSAITRELTIEHSFAYNPGEFRQALELTWAQAETVARLVTRRLPLAETPNAFDLLKGSSVDGKILIDAQL